METQSQPSQGQSTQVLADILPAPGVVVARCVSDGCGAITPLDIGPELHRQIRFASVGRLEHALRCTCGGRRGALEPSPANLTVLPSATRLFLFVV